MTRTPWPSASSRSVRWEPINPPPPVISTFIRVSFRGQEGLEARLLVVEALLPQLEAEETPALAPKARLVAQAGEHQPVVEELAIAGRGRRERVHGELMGIARQPLRQRYREAHLVLALRDHVGHQRPHGLPE